MLRSRLLVLPVLAVLSLTACGGDGDDQTEASPAGPEAAALVRTAATDTVLTGSSKFSLTSTTAIGGQDVTLAGEGSYDYDTRSGQLVFEVPGADGTAAGGGTIEQRIIGPDLYLTLPQMPGVFYRLKVAEVAGTSLGNSADPTASLTALQIVDEVEEVGTQDVRGVPTTHYRGEYDVSDAIDQAQGAAKTVLRSSLGATSLETVPFDAYLDDQGRLVRFEQVLELPGGAQTGGDPLTSRTVLELFDFGSAVVVAAPPAATVRDGAPLLAAIRAAIPQPSAAPSGSPTPASTLAPAPSPSPASPAASPSATAGA
ncbi:MAG: hypothetical protein JWN08_722 [Frankiales bacterium]|nr:hypothetical protein [Frankiales bacterium]